MGEGPEQIYLISKKEEVTFLHASIRQKSSHQLYWFPKTACAQERLLCGRICKALLEGSYCPETLPPSPPTHPCLAFSSFSAIPVFQVFPWEEETITTHHLTGAAGSWPEGCPNWVTSPFVVSSLYLVEQLHQEPLVSYIFSLARAPLGARAQRCAAASRGTASLLPGVPCHRSPLSSESPVIGEAAPGH